MFSYSSQLPTPEQFSKDFQHQWHVQFEERLALLKSVSEKALQGAEKILELNIKTGRESLEQGQAAAHKLLQSKDAKDFFTNSTSFIKPGLDHMLEYNRKLLQLNSDLQAELLRTAGQKLSESEKRFGMFLAQAEKQAEKFVREVEANVREVVEEVEELVEDVLPKKATKGKASSANKKAGLPDHLPEAPQLGKAKPAKAKPAKAAAKASPKAAAKPAEKAARKPAAAQESVVPALEAAPEVEIVQQTVAIDSDTPSMQE